MAQITCDCSVGDKCPQGRTGFTYRCAINVKEETKFVGAGYINGEEYATYGDYLAAIDKVKKGNKMTRKEAVNKLQVFVGPKDSGYDTRLFIERLERLEALELIKFDEKPPEATPDKIIEKRQQEVNGKIVVADLEASGYRIVKLGKMTAVSIDCGPGAQFGPSFNGTLLNIKQEQS